MKKLYYIDSKTGDYVSLTCQLKKEAKLDEFYNKMYHLPLDGQFSGQRSLAKKHHTGSFITTFKNIIEKDEMDSEELLDCIVQKDQSISYQATCLTAQFFDMFDYSNEVKISADEYRRYAYYCSRQGTFGSQTQRKLQMENQIYQNNGLLFDYIGYSPIVDGKENEKKKSIVKQKIVPFAPKNQKSDTLHA